MRATLKPNCSTLKRFSEMKDKIREPKARRRWTQWEIDYMKKHYTTRTSADIATWVHHPVASVIHKAFELGLRKDEAFMSERRSVGQFRKGCRSHNKGVPRKEWMSEKSEQKCAMTQFKAGCANPYSPSFRPVGYECQRNVKGNIYIWIKPEGRRMMPKHRWLWEQAYGEIPKGHCVQFKDGNTLNCVLENLYIISRKKQVRKNFDDMPAERKADVRKRIQETRNKRIKADRLRLSWGLEPKGRLIKRIQI